MPRFMGLVKMEENIGAPPQALFDAMDTYIGEQAQKGHFLDGGGLFVPTTRPANLGDEIYLILQLVDDPNRLPLTGKVVWITPVGAQGNRTAGVGIQFSESPESEAARQRIEALLAGSLASERPTQTM